VNWLYVAESNSKAFFIGEWLVLADQLLSLSILLSALLATFASFLPSESGKTFHLNLESE
jgi:hypothetical protein